MRATRWFNPDDATFAEGMVPVERIELPTFGLQNRCSTAELNRLTDGRDRRDRRPNKSVA
jgi:hypothetical protein